MHELSQRIINGDPRAAARAISYIEDDHPLKSTILKELFPYTGKAYLIGITGAPGAGKSSLVDCLISYIRKLGLGVGVIAVDPTSPFTGGAILGDRIRMQGHALDTGVFIRSMGTRGSLGGLARTSKEAVRVLDALGKDVILIETVGVGQSELDIMNIADTTAVILTPGGGDTVQAFKAGIMEIADCFVINKSDLPGTNKLMVEIEQMLDLVKHDAPWRPPLVKSISLQNQGMEDVWKAFQSHQDYLVQSGEWEQRRSGHLRDEVLEIVDYRIHQMIASKLNRGLYDDSLGQVERREKDPYEVAEFILEQWIKS
jgi:LAO/AO transport system kinase